MKTSLAALTCAFVMAASAGQARPATCYLEVGGGVYLDGDCDFQDLGDGSFTIRPPASAKQGNIFGTMIIQGKGQGEGFLSGVPGISSLGIVTRDGACWRNTYAELCAW